MLVRTDPFRDLDRLTDRLWGTGAHPAVMPMDAWRDGDQFLIEFDLPGISADAVDLDVERNVLTIRAERAVPGPDREMLAAERPRGVFSRQLVLGDNLDVEKVKADYAGGVLTLTIPVTEKGKPRKIAVTSHTEANRADQRQSMVIDSDTDQRRAVKA